MITDIKTGKQSISNNIEYEKYTKLEKELNQVIETLEFDIYTPVSAKLLEEIKQFEITIFNMRNDYDNKRFK